MHISDIGRRAFSTAAILICAYLSIQAQTTTPAISPQPVKLHHRRGLPGEPLDLKTQDGWILEARYTPAQANQLTFILLHQGGGRKEDWLPLVRALVARGYGALAVDLRGHGGSQNPPQGMEGQWWKFKKDENEWMNMSEDVDAAVIALETKGVPENLIALGGADVGSSVALRYAAVHKAVPLIFMLSPGVSYHELPTTKAMKVYDKRPILLVVGQDDRHDIPETVILYQFAKLSAGEANVSLLTVNREHGTKMLTANPGLADSILDWIDRVTRTPNVSVISDEPSTSTSPVKMPAAPPASVLPGFDPSHVQPPSR